jgi:hypothetical protein
MQVLARETREKAEMTERGLKRGFFMKTKFLIGVFSRF